MWIGVDRNRFTLRHGRSSEFWKPDTGKRSQAMVQDNQWEESGWQAMGVASHSPTCVGDQL